MLHSSGDRYLRFVLRRKGQRGFAIRNLVDRPTSIVSDFGYVGEIHELRGGRTELQVAGRSYEWALQNLVDALEGREFVDLPLTGEMDLRVLHPIGGESRKHEIAGPLLSYSKVGLMLEAPQQINGRFS